MKLFNDVSFKTSKLITNTYSTSFSLATRLFDSETREAIYNIYGFVRVADEIVDTFHGYDKAYLLEKFENDYYDAINLGISINPVLHSFQTTVKKYNIPYEYVRAFMQSMKADLDIDKYTTRAQMNEYVYGSADVVGLMCLKVFCKGNDDLFQQLKVSAMKLGSAFQKVNFLRDLKDDTENLGRNYFPELSYTALTESVKLLLIQDIENDFAVALRGIKMLPGRSKLAVLIAYYYYMNLLRKIKRTPAPSILKSRIRVSNAQKIGTLIKASISYKLDLV
ncbi:MAG TPA: phytoene/squalene synthase family protein [Bacteroidales bacterium]|nr:phytoene/squalene synthase family protein [Bacteroidales bacterium]